MGDSDRDRTVEENVAVASDQIAKAASDPTKLRSVLSYWFGVMFDEGRQRCEPRRRLKDSVTRLQAMNRQLEDHLRESAPVPEPPQED